jgi:hypothetical protein
MTRDEWYGDWADARRGLHLHPPAADLLYRRGLRDPLLLARHIRPAAARWIRFTKTAAEAIRLSGRHVSLKVPPCC